MKAMILAAGLGTRLRPITNDIPKALIKIGNVTLIEYAIKKLLKYGIKDIIINVYHFRTEIIEYVYENNYFGAHVEFSIEKDKLYNTGGGLKKAKWFFNDNNPFLIYNCDIITNLDLNAMIDKHYLTHSDITLAVRDRITNRYFLFDQNNLLRGWWNKLDNRKIIKGKEENLTPYAFSGIHIFNPEVFNYFPQEEIFSLTDFYLNICDKFTISGFNHTQDYWIDIGKLEQLELIQSEMKESTPKSILDYI